MKATVIRATPYITDTTGDGTTHRRMVGILLQGYPITCDVVLRATEDSLFEQATRKAFNTPIQVLSINTPTDCTAF